MVGGLLGGVDDFNEESLFRLPGIVDKNGILTENEFTDFATGVFIKIRNSMGIPTEEYLLSTGITQFIGNILLGNNTSYTASTSAGKSGSLFFTTADSRYLIKTIPAREAFSLKRILPNYFKVHSLSIHFFHITFFLRNNNSIFWPQNNKKICDLSFPREDFELFTNLDCIFMNS